MSNNWLPGVALTRIVNGPVFPGSRGLQVFMDQNVMDRYGRNRPGPHPVGRAEVLQDGRLAISLINIDAGRTAQALLADDLLDAFRWGDRPTIRLR